MYSIHDHYWRKRDGSVYSTGQSRELTAQEAATDQAYQAWLATGRHPTAYPCGGEIVDPGAPVNILATDTPEQVAAKLAAYVPPTYAESREELNQVLARYDLRILPLSEEEALAEAGAIQEQEKAALLQQAMETLLAGGDLTAISAAYQQAAQPEQADSPISLKGM